MKNPKTLETPEEIIKEITDACEGKRCIFRGESKENKKPVSSNFYRKFFVKSRMRRHKDKSSILEGYTKEIVDSSRSHCAPGVSDIDILTQLQHYGGKTTLIDFTYNLLIALFFACDGDWGKKGKLYIYDADGFHPISLQENIKAITKEQNCLIEPGSKEPRVIFQSSVFIYAHKGFLDVELERDISCELKRDILKYLRQNFNITTETIYNDIHGFIKNQNNYIEVIVETYKGIDCYHQQQYDKAMRHFNKAVDLNPQYAEAYNNRGNVKAEQGDREDAIRDYDRSIELNPRYAAAYYNRGIARLGQGDIEGAIRDYDKAIEFNPQYVDAYNNRGTVRLGQGDIEDAIRDYDKAIELNPQDVEVYNNRGIARLGQGDIEGAIRDYDKAIEFNPQYAGAYYNRGNARLRQGDIEGAIRDYDKTIELNPQYADAYYNRGIVKRKQKDLNGARQDWEQAKELAEQQGQQDILDAASKGLDELKKQRENE